MLKSGILVCGAAEDQIKKIKKPESMSHFDTEMYVLGF